ncbi:tyrosine-protein phosphatase 10D-like [Xenia sp. Carnegie-2017]|uniref:tyrosine-protein phosphatase 10D-like n=1 Tax=Xenia sp. Carnegie-2017 TaxID=2897299 RepID=UPI001F0477E8|nr:tyrosine-protein phosphatase 10D-like [Xenia sp. Carnegie-2017]
MVIKVAEYRGLRNGSICGSSFYYICSVDVTCDLKNHCDGERECNVTVDDNHFPSNICPGLKKYLYFEYQCSYTSMPYRKICNRHVCDNPLLKNEEKFPDSWFTAFPKSRSAAKARISSGSSWCASAADGNHYLQLNFPSLYTVNVIAIFGDSSSSSFITKYHLQTNIDGVNWKSEKSKKKTIYLGNKNGYNDAAIEKFSGGLKSKALRIFPLKFVGAPCLRIEICGGDLLPDKPTDLIATKSASTYLEISWKHPQNTGVKLGTNILNPLTRYLLILLKDTMIVFNKTLEVTDKKPYNVTNLVPYATYKVNVTAGNSEGFGRSTTATFRTAEDVPEGPPLNVQIVALSSSSLSVTWEPPDKNKTNGKIVSYTVCITHLENENCSMKYMNEEQRLDINNVKQGTKYYVRVLASTIVGAGCYSNGTWVFTNGLAPELSTKQIGNTLTYLLQNPNLEYRYFYVVAMKNGTEGSQLPSNFKNTDLGTYSEAIASAQPMPYIAAVVSRRDFKPDFTLGDGESTTWRSIGENYYNGPLKLGTNYKIFQRIFINDQGDYYSTDWSPVAATAQKHKSSDGGNTGAIAGAVVAAVLVIILVILVIHFVRINSNSATVQ